MVLQFARILPIGDGAVDLASIIGKSVANLLFTITNNSSVSRCLRGLLPRAIALVVALALFGFAIVRGTWAAGGSDSSCYALMADALAHGTIQPSLPFDSAPPWPNAALTLTPAGFFPSPARESAASPVCAPGFALVMVPLHWAFGRGGIFLATPLAAVCLVWSAFVLARRLAGDAAAALAAAAVASSPIVLFQAAQPMNDMATAAAWTAVIASATLDERRAANVMGAMTGLALLIRPNLAPVALVVALWVAVRGARATAVRRLVRFVAAALPFVIVTAAFNTVLYGSPLRLGYGNAADFFSVRFVTTNLAHYGRALVETQTPVLLLALAAPLLVRRSARSIVWLAFGVAATTAVVYLLYRPFEEWWYLRFLLPAIVPALALAAASAALLLRSPVLIGVVGVLLVAFGIRVAVTRQAFDLHRLEARFRDTGEYVRDKLPSNAVFFTVWESGTLRFHADRSAVLWDSLEPRSLDVATAWLLQRGLEPYILLERWEEPAFRQRFAAVSPLGMLDWPPRVEIDRQVRIYAPADRDAYLAGRPVPTEYVWPAGNFRPR